MIALGCVHSHCICQEVNCWRDQCNVIAGQLTVVAELCRKKWICDAQRRDEVYYEEVEIQNQYLDVNEHRSEAPDQCSKCHTVTITRHILSQSRATNWKASARGRQRKQPPQDRRRSEHTFLLFGRGMHAERGFGQFGRLNGVHRSILRLDVEVAVWMRHPRPIE